MLDASARRLCNLVLHWMMEHTDADVWAKEYKDVFFGDPRVQHAKIVSQAKLAPAVKGQQGGLNIPKREKPAEMVTDISQFLGRAGNAGKSDPNKAAIAAKAQTKKAAITIGPNADGEMTVSAPEPPNG